jgi:putative oxidoreductase
MTGIRVSPPWRRRRFTLLAAMLFHTGFHDQHAIIMFMKNIAISGRFMLLFVHGAAT